MTHLEKVLRTLREAGPVADVEDVLQSKIWAALDETRRPSKRQKDLADILRLVEKRKDLARFIPAGLKSRLSL